MKYRRLGASGLVVSEISYGSWLTFANQVELENAEKLIGLAFELGINYIDTADAYEKGKAESLLGRILPRYSRRSYIVATKAFWPMSDHVADRGLSRKHLIDSLEDSLERLKLRYVDIFYCHRYDPETPLKETLEALDDLVRRGKTLYWGVSEWTAPQIAEALGLCAAHGWRRPIVNQPGYNLLRRGIESEVLPLCAASGMGVAAFSPLAQGLLTGKYSGGVVPADSRGANEKQNMWMRDHLSDKDLLKRIDALKPIAAKYGLSQAQLALAWLLQNPAVSTLIVGASSADQLRSNVAASGVALDDGDIKAMSELFPIA